MRYFALIVAFIFSVHAASAEDVVKADGKDWLVVLTTLGDMLAACPEGKCSGSVNGEGGRSLEGYTWASLDEIYALINSYIGSPVLKPGLDTYRIDESQWATEFIDDFGISGLDLGLYWFIGSTRESNLETVAGFRLNDTRFFGTQDSFRGFIGSASVDSAATSKFLVWRESIGAQPSNPSFIVNLEEPIHSEVHSGIGLIRGWAVSKEFVEKVEVFIDGRYAFDVPIGGYREDVAAAYPRMRKPLKSGFAMAFGYSNLEPGAHIIAVRAHEATGNVKEAASQFEVTKFHKPYISSEDVFDLSYSHAELNGQEITVREVEIDGQFYKVKLKWRPYRQGFEIVEIE